MVYMPPSSVLTTPQTTTEMFSNILPHVEITNVTLENYVSSVMVYGEASQGLRLIVSLEIKVPISNSMMSSIFDSRELQKCFFVKVAASTSQHQFFQYAADPDAVPDHWHPRHHHRAELISLENFDDPQKITQEDGKTFEVYNKRVTFTIARHYLQKYVGLCVVPYINGSRLQNPGVVSQRGGQSFSLVDLSNASFYGSITSLLVIENNRVSSTEYSVVNGEVGPVGQVNKVQDSRVVRRVESLNFDFSIIEKDIFPNLQHDLRRNYLTMNKQTNHFSDIFLSRDMENNCRLLFSMNWKNILLDNSVFGKLFRDAPPEALDDLLTRTKINNFKILRTRVEGSTQEKPVQRPKDFSQNYISDVIMEFSETQGSTPIVSGFELLEFGPDTAIHNSDVRTFTCVDTEISKKSDGYYKYTVEIECIDETIGIIDQMLNGEGGAEEIFNYTIADSKRGLRHYITNLQYYYNLASKPGYSRRSMTAAGTATVFVPANFDTKRNRFTPSFAQQWQRDGQWSQGIAGRLYNDIDNFANLLDFFTNFNVDPIGTTPEEVALAELIISKDDVSSALKAMLDPSTASPQSIHEVLQLMETVASQIESILGVVYTNVPGVAGESETPEKKSHVTGKNRLFKVSDDSIDLFNANQELYRGFDFIGSTTNFTTLQNTIGLFVQSQPFLENMGLFAVGRYFTRGTNVIISDVGTYNPNVNLDQENVVAATTFLSPLHIYTGRSTRSDSLISQLTTPLPPHLYLKSLYAQLGLQQPYQTNWIDQTLSFVNRALITPQQLNRLELSRDLASFFSTAFSMSTEAREWTSIGGQRGTTTDAYRSESWISLQHVASAYEPMMQMWSNIKFLTTEKRGIRELKPDSKRSKAQELYTLAGTAPLPEGSLRPIAMGQGQPNLSGWIRNAPIQVKALMCLSVDSTALRQPFLDIVSNTNPEQEFDFSPAFEYTTQIINQLQVLEDYEVGHQKHGSQLLMKKPKWTPYNLAKPNLAPNRRYLCRISPYENEKYLITRNPKYDLPTYDEYFIMETFT